VEEDEKPKNFSAQTTTKTTSDKSSVNPTKPKTMKKTLLALLALAGFASANNASAQSAYVDGDTLLVFRAGGGTGASKNVQIDLGNLGTAGFSTINLDLSSPSSILGLTYGSGWASRNDLYYGLVGANSTDLSTTFGVKHGFSAPALTFPDLASIQPGVANAVLAGAMGNAGQGTVGGLAYTIYDINNSGSFSAADDGGFGTTFSGSITTWITGQFDIYQYGTDLNNLVVNTPVQTGTASIASGVVTVQSVPEPSTYALLGFGALLLVVAYRRANA
jgi:PEP-CTERM motif